MKENDDVNNPKHYQLFPDQQAIDVIQAALTAEEFAGYCKGNALKYRLRAGSKGDTLKCIAKANWYQNKLREAKRDSEEETGLQAELERERERRFEGNRIASAEHRDEVGRLVSDLRDHFAGLAMQGAMANCEVKDTAEARSEWAYEVADAMLKER